MHVRRFIKDWGFTLEWYRFSKKNQDYNQYRIRIKMCRYNVQGIDSVWNNKKGVVAIVRKIEEFLSLYPWIVFYVASNDISFGHNIENKSLCHVHHSSYKILLQLISLSSLCREISVDHHITYIWLAAIKWGLRFVFSVIGTHVSFH